MTAARAPRSSGDCATLDEAIDTRPIGRTRLVSFILCGLVMLVDGYDLAAMPLAVPHVVRDWGASRAASASRFRPFSQDWGSARSCSHRWAIASADGHYSRSPCC
ncbi:hypothetical protein [Sphingomonas sp. MMS24-J13]|uniref:hypothetical protein n=1 Tax=Sphingomonas sp. MMS24-J13 TaxID=3238686 RepID=UPI00384DE421